MKKFCQKKSAALIIALLIISVVAVFAFTLVRSLISSIARTGRSSDAMIAQEAAKGGIEWGLLTLKDCPVATTCYVYNGSANSVCTLNFPTDATPSSCTTVANKKPSERYADIWGSVTVDMGGRTGTIRSVGQIAGVYKGLQYDIATAVLGDYIGPTPPPVPSPSPSPSPSPLPSPAPSPSQYNCGQWGSFTSCSGNNYHNGQCYWWANPDLAQPGCFNYTGTCPSGAFCP